MFNPIRGLNNLPQISTEEPSINIQESMNGITLDQEFYNQKKKFRDLMTKTQLSWIEDQKKLFKFLMDRYEDADEYAYKIITSRFEAFSKTFFGFMSSSTFDFLKSLYKHNTNINSQVRILKAALNHEPALATKRILCMNKIGFRTMPFPGEKQLKPAFSIFTQAWSNMEPLDATEMLQKVLPDFGTESRILDQMDHHCKWLFKADTEYTVKEYIDKYDVFKDDLKKFSEELKENMAEVQRFTTLIHSQNAVNFKQYIKEVNSLKLEEDEKKKLIEIANNNYSVLSQMIRQIVVCAKIYFNHATYGMNMAYSNYHSTIRFIYDYFHERSANTKYA